MYFSGAIAVSFLCWFCEYVVFISSESAEVVEIMSYFAAPQI
jgi:hypothetical protein